VTWAWRRHGRVRRARLGARCCSRRRGESRQDGSDQVAETPPSGSEVLPLNLSHRWSEAYPWLGSNGTGHNRT